MTNPLLINLIKQHSLMRGQFTLASGVVSDYLVDLKKTVMQPYGAIHMADGIIAATPEMPDAFGGMATGAIPIVTAVCMRSVLAPPPARFQPTVGFYVRNTTKGHGTNLLIDGCLKPGMRTVLIEDVTTTGGSVLRAVQAVREFGAIVSDVITVVDRMEGATENLAAHGITLTALLTRDDLLD